MSGEKGIQLQTIFYYEINGDLDLAIKWAQKTYEDYNNRLALRYIDILEYRKTSNRILQSQEQ